MEIDKKIFNAFIISMINAFFYSKTVVKNYICWKSSGICNIWSYFYLRLFPLCVDFEKRKKYNVRWSY